MKAYLSVNFMTRFILQGSTPTTRLCSIIRRRQFYSKQNTHIRLQFNSIFEPRSIKETRTVTHARFHIYSIIHNVGASNTGPVSTITRISLISRRVSGSHLTNKKPLAEYIICLHTACHHANHICLSEWTLCTSYTSNAIHQPSITSFI
jgi:hypothetical protein